MSNGELSKIVPDSKTKTAGEFVENLEGRTGTGFAEGSRVHKDWMEGTVGYDAAQEAAQRSYDLRDDKMIKVSNLTAAWEYTDTEHAQFGLRVNGAGGQEFLALTGHALAQFSTACKLPGSSVLSKMGALSGFDEGDAYTMVKFANNSIRRVRQDKVFRLRTYGDGLCRAFLTDQYTSIDNRWYLEVLKEFLPEARLSHWTKSDEDTIYGNLLLPDTMLDKSICPDDSDYGGMLSISNCEIGKRKLGQAPSIFRAICMNGCVWGQQKGVQLAQVHRGRVDLRDLKDRVAKNIEYQLSILPDGIREYLATRDRELFGVSPRSLIAQISRERIGDFSFGFSKEEASEVYDQYQDHERADASLFGIVNAVTRAAQEFTNRRYVHFDRAGGELVGLSGTQWDAICHRASSLTAREIGKVYNPLVTVETAS